MGNDLLLKVKNYGPLREGTSNLDSGFLRVPKYTVFIGDQGTGKSTVAKLISTLSWIEKSFVRRSNNPSAFTMEKLQTLLENQNLSKEYINGSTELEFRGQTCTISLSKRKVKVLQKQDIDYVCPQIIYFPSERNILSAIGNPWEAKGLPEMVYQLANEYQNAMKRFGRRRRQLFDGYTVEFDPDTRTSYVADGGDKAKVALTNASSGLQSVTPLVVVSDFLSKGLEDDFLDRLKKTIRIRADVLGNMEDVVLRSKLQDFFFSGLKDRIDEQDEQKLKESLGRYVSSCLWQIVEEPEQNLYPTSQVKMVDRLIENTGENGKLLMTTHSPYVLSILNNYIFASDRYREFGKTVRGIPQKHMIGYEETTAYKMQDGMIQSIMDNESRMIDATEIDECSRLINSAFDRLMAMGQDAR